MFIKDIVNSGEINLKLDVSDYATGIYQVRFISEDVYLTKLVVIQQ